jgi:hypothetical protein
VQKKRALLLGIIIGFWCIFSIIQGSAQPLLPLVEQYHNNTHRIADLDLNKTRLEQNTSDLIVLLTGLECQIQNSEHNSALLNSEIAILDQIIQEDKHTKNTTERKLHWLTVLSNKGPAMFLGTITGIIGGLWMVLVFLVLLWRN